MESAAANIPFNISGSGFVSPVDRSGDGPLAAGIKRELGAGIGAGVETRAPVDRQLFDRLVLEHLPAVGRLAMRLTGRPEIAEEVAQNALLRASTGWATFRGQSAFRTWLFQIVIHAFRDDLQARRRRKIESLDEPDGPAGDQVDHRAEDPAQLASAAELGQIVAAAVSGLPPRQREVLVCHAYEQLSDLEIAAVLEISPRNVRTTLHLARERLRQVLRPHLKETDYAD